MKIILRNVLLVISTLMIIAITISLLAGYNETLEHFFTFLNKQDKLNEISLLIPTKSFYVILVAVSLFTALLLFAYMRFDSIYKTLKSFFISLVSSIKLICKDALNYKLFITLIIPIVAIIYYTFTLYPTHDEAYTYIWFVNKPFYNCMIFYPFPNNHVFYSLCANITNNIPSISKAFLMRLPAVLAFLATSLIIFSFVKKHFSEKVSLCIVALCSVVNMQLSFAIQARGYAFVSLFFVICLFAAYNILYKQENKHDWVIFSISSILGLYTIPAFLYPYVTINLLIFIFKTKEIKKQICYNAIACITVVLLYTPIMMVSGADALFANKFVQSINRLQVLEQLPQYYNMLVKDIFGVNMYIAPIIIVIILASIIYSCRSNRQRLTITFLVFLFAPFVLLLIHSVIPYTRVFIYYTIVIVILVCITWEKYINKLSIKGLIVSLLVIQSVSINNWINELKNYEVMREFIGQTYNPIIDDPNNTFYYVSGDLDFLFEISARNMNNQMKVDEFLPFANADTVHNFKYVIIEKDRDKTVNRLIYMSNKKMNIYKIHP